MDVFPAFYPLKGRIVVVAGHGEPAEARARLFEGSPAQVIRPDEATARDPSTYGGAVLAFIAGGAEEFLHAAATAARTAGVPVNVMDHPELCDFTTPAIIDRGAVVAAVGTGGAAPILAAALRGEVEARLPEGIGEVASLLGELRQELRAALPDAVARRAFLRRAIGGPGAEAAAAGRLDEARALLRAAMAQAGRPVGRICVITPPGSADLLTLRAARRLAEADVLVLGEDAPTDVVVLARRDARRIRLAEADLAALAAEGLTVVVVADASPSAFEASGITVETL